MTSSKATQAILSIATRWNLTEDQARRRYEREGGDVADSASHPHKAKPAEASTVVEQVEQHFKRFLAIDPILFLVLALWCLATHLYECFDAFPYLAITSPAKRCGKTRSAELLELFTARPMRTVGATPAVLFRSIQAERPTLMLDEAEGLRRAGDDRAAALTEILNAGYRKGQTVRRCEPSKSGGYAVKAYAVYCPKVLVLIGDLPDTLNDRAIPIPMRRKFKNETVERFIMAKAKGETAPVEKACEEWAASHQNQVAEVYEGMDLPFLVDREAELWLPLFSVCRVAAPHRYEELEKTARKLAGHKNSDEAGDHGIRLLSDIRAIFSKLGQECIQTFELLCQLNAIDDAPWSEYRRGKALNAPALATLLRPFGVQPSNHRFGDLVRKGYLMDDFTEAFERYLP